MRVLTIAGILLLVSVGFGLAPANSGPEKKAEKSEAFQALTTEQSAFFESRIRPIFVSHCYKCHSVEQGKSKGGLLLDSREGWMKGGDGGPVVTPGQPENSRLIKAIGYGDPDLQMPPKGEKLSATQVADLTTWVKMGAPDPRVGGTVKLTGLNDKARSHWAYQPVKKPEVPTVKTKGWVNTPIDAFILAKLESEQMTPARVTTRATLIRRAYFDLIGLPPSPLEVRAFVYDSSPNAFEKVVDKLLASPQYGERWGRFWLDSARYSDTSGAEAVRKEDYRFAHAWTYRDYVIKAFNDDKPYDQFLREQIAADLLPDHEKNPESLAAMGFITVGKRFPNGNDTIDERIDTLTKAMLGLTVACARCHDHKFDPIPTADYYSLHGIFSSTVEPVEKPMIGAPPTGSEYEEYKAKLAELENKNREIYYKLIEEKSADFRKKAGAYLLASVYGRRNHPGDGALRNKLVSENKLDRDVFTGLRANRAAEFAVYAPLTWFADVPEAKFTDRVSEVLRRIAYGPSIRPLNKLVIAAFKDVQPESIKSISDVTDIYQRMFAGIEDKTHAFVEANRTAKSTTVEGYDADTMQLITILAPVEPAPAITTEHLRELLSKLPAANNRAYGEFVFAALNELELTHPGAPPRAMVVRDSLNPKDSPIFIRGEARNHGPIAPRQFMEILAGPERKTFKDGSGRLELAQAIADRNNPLTARVLVNRVWMHHFGEGFVRTPDDLGVQSEPPSHPELLDYLTNRFMDEGWSIKKLHRLIMLSKVYQQSSDSDLRFAKKDPENRLLWRANIRRLDFEAIRDSLLMFTGRLDLAVGGKPMNLTDEPYSDRRSVYGYIDRGKMPELMSQFDFADPNRANSHRTTTIVPQQALFFMNSPMSADVARKVTSRPEFLNARTDYARVNAIYEVIFQREPRAAEVQLAAAFYNAHPEKERAAALNDPEGAPQQPGRTIVEKTMKGPGTAKRAIHNEGQAVSREPLNIWQQYVQALLCANEIAYVN